MVLFPREPSAALPGAYEVRPSQEWDGNDGTWSTFKITLGSPAQEFRVLASTQSGQTFAIVPDGCIVGEDPSGCSKSRGAQVFNSAQSPGYLTNQSSTWEFIGMYDIDLEDRLNQTARGMFGYEKVALGPAGNMDAVSLDSQVVGGVADMSYYLGHIPLGVSPSKFSTGGQSVEPLIYQLRNDSQIPSLSFSYTAGAKYRLKSVVGQLILGGYDPTRFEPTKNEFSFSFSADPSRLLTVGVESITATDTLFGVQSLSSSAHFSLIDSTVPHLWLPRSVCDEFERSFGLTYDPHTDLYLINSTMRDLLLARSPTITIKLVESLDGAVTNFSNIVLPYSAFDLQASYPYYANATNYFPIRRAANESQYTLGRTLLQEAYLIVDYERANFTVAQAIFPDPLPNANIVSISPPGQIEPSSNSSGLSKGAKAGIAVGCVALVSLLVAMVFFLFRRRRQHHTRRAIGAHGNVSELHGAAVSEIDSASTASPHPHKILSGTQEIDGTPRAELASPFPGKSFVSVNEVPQELETPSSTMQPRFEEVTASEYNSYRSERELNSRIVSEELGGMDSHTSGSDIREYVVSPLEGRSVERTSVVSPLAGRFSK